MSKLCDALQQSGIVWERDYATNVNLEQKFGILSLLYYYTTVLACTAMSAVQTTTREELLLGSIKNALETRNYVVSELSMPFQYV